jgi:hypothetical protein
MVNSSSTKCKVILRKVILCKVILRKVILRKVILGTPQFIGHQKSQQKKSVSQCGNILMDATSYREPTKKNNFLSFLSFSSSFYNRFFASLSFTYLHILITFLRFIYLIKRLVSFYNLQLIDLNEVFSSKKEIIVLNLQTFLHL